SPTWRYHHRARYQRNRRQTCKGKEPGGWLLVEQRRLALGVGGGEECSHLKPSSIVAQMPCACGTAYHEIEGLAEGAGIEPAHQLPSGLGLATRRFADSANLPSRTF